MKDFISAENITASVALIYLFVVPLLVGAYKASSYTYYLTCIILTLSVTLVWGYTGIFSFGQGAFFGIGGYAYGIIMQLIGKNEMSIPIALVAIIIAGLVAALIGYFMFYGGINDVFVGLITMCVTIALTTFMGQTSGEQWKIGSVSLGGYNGLSGVPSIQLGPIKLSTNGMYYFVLIIMVLIYLFLRRFLKTREGYSLIAIRENRERSELFGYNINLTQTLVFGVGGMIAGLGGVLYAAWGNYITPDSMSLASSTIPVVLAAAGGRKNATAAMIFTFIYYFISRRLSATGSQYTLVFLGFFLIFVILIVPDGLLYSAFNKVDQKIKK
ncbi:MAG TPA: urea ABC transporter permease [Lachnospiraceae bacterium]|nr:urea ABC transporter permease [Lachnospiraceae bacterium]